LKKLHEYLGEVVKVISKSGRIVYGEVIDYVTALQNVEEYKDREMESISIQQVGYSITFFADEIMEIETANEVYTQSPVYAVAE
jgi:small nuclear ribonucleoprotein (snRNP)-like protein